MREKLPIYDCNKNFIIDENVYGDIVKIINENPDILLNINIYLPFPTLVGLTGNGTKINNYIKILNIIGGSIYYYMKGNINKIEYHDINDAKIHTNKKDMKNVKESLNSSNKMWDRLIKDFRNLRKFENIEELIKDDILMTKIIFRIEDKVSFDLIIKSYYDFREFVSYMLWCAKKVVNGYDLVCKNDFVDATNLLYCGLGLTLITNDKNTKMKPLWDEKDIKRHRIISLEEFKNKKI